MNTAQKLVGQIKAQQIQPRPRWYYTGLKMDGMVGLWVGRSYWCAVLLGHLVRYSAD
jgi:hypothetical protein